MASKKMIMGMLATVAAAGMLLTPSIANAEPAESNSSEVVTVPMSWDCSTFTEADRQKAVREGVNICGALDKATGGIAPRVTNRGNCGTASMYVDRLKNGNRVVSWGLHSTAGVMVQRSLSLSWTGGGFLDVSPMWTEDYSNSRVVKANGRVGGTMNGTVGVLGWSVTCSVYTWADAV